MKRVTFFLLFSLIFLISGCLSYRAVEWRIQFNDNFNGGKVTVTFEDLTSDELNLNIFSKGSFSHHKVVPLGNGRLARKGVLSGRRESVR